MVNRSQIEKQENNKCIVDVEHVWMFKYSNYDSMYYSDEDTKISSDNEKYKILKKKNQKSSSIEEKTSVSSLSSSRKKQKNKYIIA